MRPGSANATQSAKLQWGDLDDEDGEKELDLLLLPPKQVIAPNENGIRKVIEYKLNEKGQQVKITTTTTTRTKSVLMSKAAVKRRSWTKFGDAVNEDASLTVVSKEEIKLERPKALGTNTAHELPKTTIEGGNTTLKLCRTCGKKGDHWTAQCPHKDLATENIRETSSSGTAKTSKIGAYVPPGMRPGARKTMRNDENSVRVSNLSEDARDDDLRELFSIFGEISRAHVVLERETQDSRGFGFVNFVHKEHGQRAIDKLNGYGYDNLILRVEWATPRTRPN